MPEPSVLVAGANAQIVDVEDPALIDAILSIPGGRWSPEHKTWAVALGPDRAEALALLAAHFDLRTDSQAAAALTRMRRRRDGIYPTIEAVDMATRVSLSICDDWHHSWATELRALPGASPQRAIGRVNVPLEADSAGAIADIVRWRGAKLSPRAGRRLEEELDTSRRASRPTATSPSVPASDLSRPSQPDLFPADIGASVLPAPAPRPPTAAEIQRRADRARADALVELSRASDYELTVAGLGDELLPFQRAGVAYVLRQRQCFIADEQGLGKTVQALAAVQADGAFPGLVVCPASLKLNWQREAGRWLPHRRVQVLESQSTVIASGVDLVVANYDVIHALLPELGRLGLKALIADESHYCKNAKARRTRAMIELSSRLPPDALRLALSGTPVVNRPEELAPQLRLIGRLEEVSSAGSLARRFRGRYGARLARERLHRTLRSTCYVRRTKAEVLSQLPDKRRLTVAMPLTNRGEYDRLEENLLAWLRDLALNPDDLAQKIAVAERARALVKLTALRRAAAEGKLEAAIEWIGDFLHSGQKLIVFAHHRHIQDSLRGAFPAAALIRGDDRPAERDRQSQRFQTDEAVGLCICSLEVASHGFTLTAAADIAFLELGWNPARHDQAEDRAHRIGQTREVTAWYLLAAGTIDERIAALIDRKRGELGEITDGTAADEASMLESLLSGMLDDAPGSGGSRVNPG